MDDIRIGGMIGLNVQPKQYNQLKAEVRIDATVEQLTSEEGQQKIRDGFVVLWQLAEEQMETEIRTQVEQMKKMLGAK